MDPPKGGPGSLRVGAAARLRADPDVGRRARSDGSDLTEEVLFAGQILRLPDRTRPVQCPQFG